MRTILAFLAGPVLLGACAFAPPPEEDAVVYVDEPIYCYRSLGAVGCFERPHHRDERRLVNYYGRSPAGYDRPAPPPAAILYPPPAIEHFARDPEPVLEPAPPKAAPVPRVQGR